MTGVSVTVCDMEVTTKVPVWARRVKAARGSETQESFAHRAGISTATLSRIERGKHTPRWGTCLALSEATGKPASYFLDEEEEESILARLHAFLTDEIEARRRPERRNRRAADQEGVSA